jgi:hypothetical protein
MSTTTDEISVDIDELDRKKAESDAKKGAGAKKEPDKDPVEVVRTDADTTTPKKEVLKPEEGLEKLKKQLDDEKTARIDAERRARESAEAEVRARTETQDSHLNLMTTAIETIKQSNETLKSNYAEAMAAQDYAKVAEIQIDMSTNAAKLLRLEEGKVALEKAPKPTARVPQDVVEEYAGRIPVEFPRSRAWVRAHPDFVRDPQKNRQMIAAHELALARGHTADTDDYFASIEKTLDLNAPIIEQDPAKDDIDPMKDTAKLTRTHSAPPAAPVTRSGNGAGSRPNVVTLSPAEVEIAALTGLTPEEYARQKIAIKKERGLN